MVEKEFDGEIESMEHLVGLTKLLNGCWYRGHPKEYGDLTPRVFRPEFSVDNVEDDFETQVAVRFRREAPSSYSPCPEGREDADWLVLMQHYGLPTRLLDWTASVLTGLYFSVESKRENGKLRPKKKEESGELWMLSPGALNEWVTKSTGVHATGHTAGRGSQANLLAREVFRETKGITVEGPIAIAPTVSFRRAAAQQSFFTIHPRRFALIGNILRGSEYLKRFRIPGELKETLRDGLVNMGVSASTLFPDLQGLAKSIEHAEARRSRHRLRAQLDAQDH